MYPLYSFSVTHSGLLLCEFDRKQNKPVVSMNCLAGLSTRYLETVQSHWFATWQSPEVRFDSRSPKPTLELIAALHNFVQQEAFCSTWRIFLEALRGTPLILDTWKLDNSLHSIVEYIVASDSRRLLYHAQLRNQGRSLAKSLGVGY
jgi:hypothetical protein